MTPANFKSWFEGFTEAMTGQPTKAQWARIKERVAEIDGRPVTERVFIDRYWSHYYPSNPWRWTYLTAGNNAGATHGAASIGCNSVTLATSNSGAQQQYSAANAMYALGKADAQSLAA